MPIKLEPVDYDPFATPAEPSISYEPVDYDPFAGAPAPGSSPAPVNNPEARDHWDITRSALKTVDQAQGTGYKAVRAIGNLTGSETLQDIGQQGVDRNKAEASAYDYTPDEIASRFGKDAAALPPSDGIVDKGLTAWDIGKFNTELGTLRYQEMEGDTSPQTVKRIAELKAEMKARGHRPEIGNLFEEAVESAASFAPTMVESFKGAQEQGLQGAIAGTALGASTGPASPITAPAGAAAGYSAGTLAGGFDTARKLEAGLAYDEMLETGIDPEVAKVAAHIYGAAAGAVEIAQIRTVLSTIPGGKKLMGSMLKETVEKVAEKLTKSQILRQGALRYGKDVGVEVAQEMTQEGMNIAATETAKVVSNRMAGTSIDPTTGKQVADRMAGVLVDSMLGLGLMSGPGSVLSTAINLKGAQKNRKQDLLDKNFGENEGFAGEAVDDDVPFAEQADDRTADITPPAESNEQWDTRKDSFPPADEEEWKQWEEDIQAQRARTANPPTMALAGPEVGIETRQQNQQYMENMEAPGVPWNHGQQEVDGGVAEFRRIRQQKTEVERLKDYYRNENNIPSKEDQIKGAADATISRFEERQPTALAGPWEDIPILEGAPNVEDERLIKPRLSRHERLVERLGGKVAPPLGLNGEPNEGEYGQKLNERHSASAAVVEDQEVFDTMQAQVNESHSRGTGYDETGSRVSYGASSPKWMENLQEAAKAGGQPLFGRKELNVLFNKVRNGWPLTEKQEVRFDLVRGAATEVRETDPDFAQSYEAEEIESQGYTPMGGQEVPAVDLEQGSSFIGTVDGTSDTWDVTVNDDSVTLRSEALGIEKTVDLFDSVKVDGIKSEGQAPGASREQVGQSLGASQKQPGVAPMTPTAMSGTPAVETPKPQETKAIEKKIEQEVKKVNTAPTEKQIEAGNYKKGHIRIQGFDISIENPDSSVRSGTDTQGNSWTSRMHGHYGYFRRSLGRDGDQVDVVVAPGATESPKIFIVDQVDPETFDFDEHKVVFGVNSEEEAEELYRSNYADGWEGFGGITEMPPEKFKEWLGDKKRTQEPLYREGPAGSNDIQVENDQPQASLKKEAQENAPSPTGSLKDRFESMLSSGHRFKNIMEARKVAGGYTGEKIKAGTVKSKAVDENIEAAAVNVARKIVEAGGSREEVFDKLVDLQDRMPNLNVRTSTSIKDQAYSTPLSLAYLVSELAGITDETTVYEPSAGNGALVIGANPKKTTVNELNPDRVANLKTQGFKSVMNSDGTKIVVDLVLKNDVVVANPPFGIVKDENRQTRSWSITKNYTTMQIDHAMVFQALKSMKDNGRAVFIIGSVNDKNRTHKGRQLLYRNPDKVRFFKTLYDNYNVVDHFSVAGKLYSKQGAAWPVDVITIQGKGKSSMTLPGAEPPPLFTIMEELKGKLNETDAVRMGPRRTERSAEAGRGNMDSEGGSDKEERVSRVPGRENSKPPRRGGGGQDRGRSNLGRHDENSGNGDAAGSSGGPGRSGRGRVGTDRGKSDSKGRLGNDGNLGAAPDKTADTGHPRGKGHSGKRQHTGLGSESYNSIEEELSNTSEAQLDAMLDDVFGKEEPVPPVPSPQLSRQKTENKGKTAAKKASIESLAGVKSAVKGLGALFTPKNSLGSGLVFNEETYAAAKPHFEEAWAHAKEAGFSIKELIQYLSEQFDSAIRPYLKKYLLEQQAQGEKTSKKKTAPVKKKAPEKIKDTATQAAYHPASKSSVIGTLTPVNMSRSIEKALAEIEKNHGSVDQYVADKLGYTKEEVTGTEGKYGFFSGEQVDAIALAINNIDNGAGFVIGDQTGVGKGRVVAAMIRYSIKKGLTPIFVTEKPNLYADMYRDLSDIGMADMDNQILITNAGQTIPLTENGSKQIKTKSKHNDILRKAADEEKLPSQYKAVFTTYDQMNATPSVRRDFIDAMSRGGMLILDEAHNAGGTEGSKMTGKKYPRSLFFRKLVQQARSVFYSSATYAKRPGVMDLYSKTDMQLAVEDISKIGDAITAGGVPLQQVVASMLTEAGQYVRRERSFDGITYDTKPTKIDRNLANNAARAFSEIRAFSEDYAELAVDNLADEMAATGSGASSGSSAKESALTCMGFSSIMHNLVNQMLLSMKTQGAVDEAIRAFKEEGKKPVITLSNTMGSFISKYATENNLVPGDGIGLRFNDLIFDYLDKTRRYTEKDPFKKGKVIQHYLEGSDLPPGGVAEFKRIKNLIYKLDMGGIPVSPVDYIKAKLNEAGMTVSEITGRDEIINYEPDGTQRYGRRSSAEKSIKGRTKTIYDFNADNLDALILNRSGSTGLSLHALAKFEGHDPAPRHMIVLQAEANIDTHMQMLGRVNRAGQLVPPSYAQLVGDTPAEMRPASILAAKMASLNANTTASTESEVTAKGTLDFINKYGDQVVAGLMMDFPDWHTALGAPLPQKNSGLEPRDAAKKVTGKIPMLPIAEQEELYSMIESGYKELIDQLNAMGENDLEAKTFDTDAKVLKEAVVFEGTGDSPFQAEAKAEVVDMKKLGKSYTGKQVRKLLHEEVYGKKANEVSLNQLVKDGMHEASKQFLETLERFEDYKLDVLDDIEKAERRHAQETKLETLKSDWTKIARNLYPGRTVQVLLGEMVYPGTVLKVQQSGKPKNPLAMGTWKVTMAVADSSRRITISFGKMRSQEDWGDIIGAIDEDFIQRFDQASQDAREERTIITGNMLAAYSQYEKGRIINYTSHNGELKQGILMPRGFDLDKANKERPVILANTDRAMEVIDHDLFIRTADDLVIRSTGEGDYVITAPASKAKGGKYYLNDRILKALGTDFVKAGNRMKVTVSDKKKVRSVVDYVLKELNETWMNTADAERIRRILGMEVETLQDVAGGATFRKKITLKKETGKYGEGTVTRDTEALESFLAKVGNTEGFRRGHLKAVQMPVDLGGAARRIEKALGKKIVFLENSNRKGFDFEGITIPTKPNTLYIDAATTMPINQVVAHELLHSIRRTDKALYEKLKASIFPQIKHIAQFRNELADRDGRDRESIQDSLLYEELIADFVGQHITETDFWRTVIEGVPLRKRLVLKVKAFLKKLLNTLGFEKKATGADKYFQDIPKVLKAIDQALADYSPGAGGAQGNKGGNLTFSRKSKTEKANKAAVKALFKQDDTWVESAKDMASKALSKEERQLAEDRFLTKTLDHLHFIKRRLGDRAYKMHRVLTGVKSATFAMFLEHGALAWDGDALTVKTKGKGVLPFLKSIGPDYENLLKWIAAKRAEELDAQGRENWLTEARRQAIFDMVGTHSKSGKSWEYLNKRFQTINKNTLDIAEQAGLIDPEARAMWEQDFYIPFYRIFEDKVSKEEFLSGPKGAKKHISAQIRHLKGGEAQIGDLLQNSLTNWMHLVDASARNKARAAAFDAGTELGIIEEVEKKDLVNILGVQNLKRFAVIKAGGKKANAIFDTAEEADAWAYHLTDKKGVEYLVEPRKSTSIKFGSMKDLGVFSFQRDGKPVYFKTEDQDLYEALCEMDTTKFKGFLMQLMGKAKRGLSMGATISPLFRINNMIRDTVHTAVVAQSFSPVVDSARGFVKAMREDSDYIEFMASGFGFGSSYVHSDDPEVGAKFIKQIVKREGRGAIARILTSPAKIFNLWEKIGEASENAARLQLYSNLKKKGMSKFDAGFEGRDLLDFSMQGSSSTAQMLIRTLPFLNARFQGLYKLGRAAKEKPLAFFAKASILMMASLALWGTYKDDERYKELEDWDKWSFFHFWFGGKHYRIPKPFEIGAFFCSLPESIGNVLNGTEDASFLSDWAWVTAKGIFNIDLYPQLLKPVIEAEIANKNTFTGRAVVPKYMEGLPKAEQYSPWTSETSREIGKRLNISPLKIQHYVRGYAATLGMIGLTAVDDLFTRKAFDYPERPAGENKPWGLGRLVSDENKPARNTKYVTKFYDLAEEIGNAQRTFNYYVKTGQGEKAQDWFKENAPLMAMNPTGNSVKKLLAQINAEMKRIQKSTSYSAEEKQRRINRLTEQRNQFVKKGFNAIRQASKAKLKVEGA
ncbi:MAG: DEAD/DEAH box helicase family protein [Desulfobacteraceae bacterium]|nr:DEAD/DEAH box helicase family protein [Desulfobacteraceae bacterium]